MEGYERVGASADELKGLPRVADTLPLSAWMVAVVELAERFTYYGISSVLQNYMQIPRHNQLGQPGALGLGHPLATAIFNMFLFWAYSTPILGAWLADSYLGRYKTIVMFAAVYMVGTVVLVLSALPVVLDHGYGLPGLILALIVIGLGTGGIKSNVAPLIADQYTVTRPYVRTTGSRTVVVDPGITIQSIFMVFYLCINIGSQSPAITTVLEHSVDFWAAYLVPALIFPVAIGVLLVGAKHYVKKPPVGSVIPDAFRVCWLVVRSGRLDLAKPSVRQELGLPLVGTWSDAFVDEVRRALVACRVFCVYPLYWLAYGQMTSNFVSQAGTMQTHGIPNDLMQNIDSIALIVMIPVTDRLVYPFLRRIGIPFLPISRIFCGLLMAALTMAYAALVQHWIYSAGPCYEYPLTCPDALVDGIAQPNQVSILWQVPAYVMLAFSEVLASVTGSEYAYTHAPENLKSFITSLFLLTTSLGAGLGVLVSPWAVDPYLTGMYSGLTVAMVGGSLLFWLVLRKHNVQEEYALETNEMAEME